MLQGLYASGSLSSRVSRLTVSRLQGFQPSPTPEISLKNGNNLLTLAVD